MAQIRRCQRHRVGEQRVGAERHMTAVLLDRPERQNHHGAVAVEPVDLARAQFLEAHRQIRRPSHQSLHCPDGSIVHPANPLSIINQYLIRAPQATIGRPGPPQRRGRNTSSSRSSSPLPRCLPAPLSPSPSLPRTSRSNSSSGTIRSTRFRTTSAIRGSQSRHQGQRHRLHLARLPGQPHPALPRNTPTDVIYGGQDWLPAWAAAGFIAPLDRCAGRPSTT